ncbi:MAG: hypothetical protein ACKVP5_15440 [Aestuariivirga sp.]
MADYEPKSATGGNLIGLCESCGTLMNKRIKLADLSRLLTMLDVSIRQADRHLFDNTQACPNDPLHKDAN